MFQIDERLKEIRERAEQATPGPWGYDQFSEYVYNHERKIADVGDDDMTDRDGFFIAEARQDIPFLLDVIHKLRWMLLLTKHIAQITVEAHRGFDDNVDDLPALLDKLGELEQELGL